MNETMLLALKGIAEADGVTVTDLVLNEVSRLIEERRAYWSRLDSIFRDDQQGINAIRVDQCDTGFVRAGPIARNTK